MRSFIAGICTALALVIVAASAVVMLTSYADGSGRVGDLDGGYVLFCMPWGTCAK